jgi:low temperature requirement protein LtrA
MAVVLPDAFHGQALSFGFLYVLVRSIGLALYAWVASTNPNRKAAVRVFSLLSVGGFVAVIVGAALGGAWQYVVWGIAIVLDVIAAAVGGRQEGWDLHLDHFGERHGLFVIIALGETLIVAAGTVTGAIWTANLIAAAILAVAITCGLWWSYFPLAKPALDNALEAARGTRQTILARDVYSLIHFPTICGIIAVAVVMEEALAHPESTLPVAANYTLAAGLLLFVGGMAMALWRATGSPPIPRLIVMLAVVILMTILGEVTPVLMLAIAFAGIILVAIIEQRGGLIASGRA